MDHWTPGNLDHWTSGLLDIGLSYLGLLDIALDTKDTMDWMEVCPALGCDQLNGSLDT